MYIRNHAPFYILYLGEIRLYISGIQITFIFFTSTGLLLLLLVAVWLMYGCISGFRVHLPFHFIRQTQLENEVTSSTHRLTRGVSKSSYSPNDKSSVQISTLGGRIRTLNRIIRRFEDQNKTRSLPWRRPPPLLTESVEQLELGIQSCSYN